MAFEAGEIVLVPFPYRDRLAEKTRPAVIVSGRAYNQLGDLVIVALTSQGPRFSTDYALLDWAASGLKFPTTARMLIATIAAARVQFLVGRLSARDRDEVRDRLLAVLSWP